jgi:hypothetical protein
MLQDHGNILSLTQENQAVCFAAYLHAQKLADSTELLDVEHADNAKTVMLST